MPTRNLTAIIFTVIVSWICHEKASERRFANLIAEGMDEIQQSYVRDVDRRELFENAMRGMIGHLDPYSEFISPDELQQFNIAIKQEFGGIGITVEQDEGSGYLLVVSPLVGTPAYRADIRAGDKILQIDGEDTRELKIPGSIKMMRGAPGSKVELSVLHEGDETPVTITVERAIIQVESVLGDFHKPDGSWDYHLEGDPQIGYLRIQKFGEQTASEVTAAIHSLTAANAGQPIGLILDLRGNPGGLLDAAVQVCDLFLDSGEIVSTRGRDTADILESYQAHTDRTQVPDDMPVVVLIDHQSASASEIVAACLQDHHRATIVGQRSWGKGTVQQIIPMERGRSAMRLTTATYWRPSGQNIHRQPKAEESAAWGVLPDEGFDVALPPDQVAAIVHARRQRDIVRREAATAAVTSGHSSSPNLSEAMPDIPGGESTSAAPVESRAAGTASTDADHSPEKPFIRDPQLRRAVDHLRSQLHAQS